MASLSVSVNKSIESLHCSLQVLCRAIGSEGSGHVFAIDPAALGLSPLPANVTYLNMKAEEVCVHVCMCACVCVWRMHAALLST
jgi:hypothetical protein